MNERDDIAVDDVFATRAKALFDESVDGLDGETRSRLNRGRQKALAEAATGGFRWMPWAPAGGLAAAAVIAVVIFTGNPQFAELAVPEVATDMEILLTEDSLEMIEDLEFYSWIDFDAEASDNEGPANNVG